ncbi:uncharacterized protein B0H18DRAFT_410243 [Fomitopsis serialis]|uniref:uncharacterized protein n=1 Tax=Fomitopsis serialis TaxID=139415 RepID=UPI002007BA2E|nr:uncharacterized protein B0H18DRAFT_410243 [Neoantrodia serialis]KAH9935321.1 hypothetical protein B0H18DRAFT_410243 [Neoantrodia serialis]
MPPLLTSIRPPSSGTVCTRYAQVITDPGLPCTKAGTAHRSSIGHLHLQPALPPHLLWRESWWLRTSGTRNHWRTTLHPSSRACHATATQYLANSGPTRLSLSSHAAMMILSRMTPRTKYRRHLGNMSSDSPRFAPVGIIQPPVVHRVKIRPRWRCTVPFVANTSSPLLIVSQRHDTICPQAQTCDVPARFPRSALLVQDS